MSYLTLTAQYVRDLLNVDESLIKIGYLGYELEDFDTEYISIDNLTPTQIMAVGESFNGTTEVSNYHSSKKATVTVTFYNGDALPRAETFENLVRSYNALTICMLYDISVSVANGATDLSFLAGSQYTSRAEVTINVSYSTSANVDTPYVDSTETEITYEV